MRALPTRNRRLLIAPMFLTAAGCATSAPATLPDTGTLTVGVTSASMPGSANVLSVIIDSEAPRPVRGDSAVITARDVAPGDHVVKVGGVPASCRVEGEHPRRVTITPRRTSAIRFAITCR